MDALPPTPIHCEADRNAVQLTVNATPDEPNYTAFMSDLRYYDSRWTVISDKTLEGKRTFVLRAPSNVTHFAVTAAKTNAHYRGWTTQVTFVDGPCLK